LTVDYPDGQRKVYGGNDREIVCHVTVNNKNFFRKCLLFGSLGLGESYVEGDWDADDITKLISLVILNINNNQQFDKKKSSANFLHLLNVIFTFFRANTLLGSKKNISDHYDLGNEFFKTFLDASMTYSSAFYEDSEQSLQEAQQNKYKNLCENLRLKSTDRVLEIGSGWGGFALYATKNYGCHVTTTTISKQQFNYVERLIKKEKLESKITVILSDYRELTGKYDKVASIEMIEAVGHKFLPKYFEQCHALLKDDGLLGLQMILFPDRRYEISRKSVDFIQKHIFPGSLLPSMKSVHDALYKTGDLNLYRYEDISSHYVKTLLTWKENFNRNKQVILDTGKDEHFLRKWNYYFSYCAAAFQMRHISVVQAVFTRSNNHSLHDGLEVALSAKDQEMLQQINDNAFKED
jgi:cyclopropane-fatty-acyl-phospholipid synthase